MHSTTCCGCLGVDQHWGCQKNNPASEDNPCSLYKPSRGSEVQESIPPTGAMKFDTGKTDLTLIPYEIIKARLDRISDTVEDGATYAKAAAIALAEFAQDGEDPTLLWDAFDNLCMSIGSWAKGVHGLSHARAFGAQKYARSDWRNGFKESRLIAASLRHLIGGVDPEGNEIPGYLTGETLDRESGLDHRFHALFGPAVAIDQREREAGEQDLK